MLELGDHAAFIIGSYAAVTIGLAGLIAWIIADARQQARMLAELEAQGVIRRSAGSDRASGAKGTAK